MYILETKDNHKLSHTSGTGPASMSSHGRGLHYVLDIPTPTPKGRHSVLASVPAPGFTLCTGHWAEAVLSSRPFVSLLADTPRAMH